MDLAVDDLVLQLELLHLPHGLLKLRKLLDLPHLARVRQSAFPVDLSLLYLSHFLCLETLFEMFSQLILSAHSFIKSLTIASLFNSNVFNRLSKRHFIKYIFVRFFYFQSDLLRFSSLGDIDRNGSKRWRLFLIRNA